MKRILLFFVLLPMLCSCGRNTVPPCLDSYPMTLTGRLEYGQSVYDIKAVITDGDKAEITFLSPPLLSGYCFKVDKDSVWVYYDNTEIALASCGFDIPCALIPEMLNYGPEDFEYCKKDKNTRVYYYTDNGGNISVYADKDSSFPQRVDYTRDGVELSLIIENLTVQ